MRGVRANDDLASMDGTIDISGEIPFGSMNALYIETMAYGVHATRKMNIMARFRLVIFFSKRMRLFTIGFSFFMGSFMFLTFLFFQNYFHY